MITTSTEKYLDRLSVRIFPNRPITYISIVEIVLVICIIINCLFINN